MWHHWMHHRRLFRGYHLAQVGPYAHLDEVPVSTLSDVTLTKSLYDADTHTRDNPYKAKTITINSSLLPTNRHIFLWCDTLEFDFSINLIGQGLQANGSGGGTVSGVGVEGRVGGSGGSGGGAGAAKCTGPGCPFGWPTDHTGDGGSNGGDGGSSQGTSIVSGGTGYGRDLISDLGDNWSGYLQGGNGGDGGDSEDLSSSQTTNGGSGGNASGIGAGGGGGGALYITGGGTQTGGAGGGGAGGKVIVVARRIVNLQTSNGAYFTAKGGNGGSTSTFKTDYFSGSGGGGGGGTIQVWANNFEQAGIATQQIGGLAGNGFYGGAQNGNAGQAKIYSFDECCQIEEQNFSTSWDFRC